MSLAAIFDYVSRPHGVNEDCRSVVFEIVQITLAKIAVIGTLQDLPLGVGTPGRLTTAGLDIAAAIDPPNSQGFAPLRIAPDQGDHRILGELLEKHWPPNVIESRVGRGGFGTGMDHPTRGAQQGSAQDAASTACAFADDRRFGLTTCDFRLSIEDRARKL